jgi:tetratricopeptide (TPR) repeat protein
VDLSMGNIGRALDKMQACIEHAELAGFVIPQAISRAEMGAAYASLGEIDRGERLAEEGLAIALEHNAIAIPIAKAAQAEIFLLAGRLEDAEAAIAEAALTKLPGLLHFAAAANAQILKGRIAVIRGDHAGAVEIADQVVEWLRPLGVRPYIPAALLLKGSSLVELGELDEAERALLEGSAEAEQLGFDPIRWQIEMALSGVAAATGDEARAAELRGGASDIIDRIAGSIDDAELRSSFLGLPEVRRVIG